MQRGGGKKKNKEKMGFTPVEDMITSIGTEFDVLTAESLFGFMVTMDVPVQYAEYYGRSKGGIKLNSPITKYLLKLSVIDVTQHYLDPIVLEFSRGYNKSSETPHHFYKEALLQQRIWLESIVGGSVPICPDVYSISYNCGDALFSRARNSTASFKRKDVEKYPQVHDYLMKYHTSVRSAKIGAIAMEYIPNSRTLYEVMLPSVDDEAFKRRALITAGAQVLRLFLNHAVIHADLHMGNILVDEMGMSYIIDFGIVLDLKDESSRHYERMVPFRLMESRDRYYADFHQRPNRRDSEGDRADIKTTCHQIMVEIMRAETAIFRRCQMDFLFDELTARDLFYEVGVQYKELSASSGVMSQKTINKKIKEGEIELITDAGLGDALVQQVPFLQPNCVGPISEDYYVATRLIARTDESEKATVPINETRTIPLSDRNNAIGITKKKRFRVKKIKKQEKTKRRRG